MTRPHVLILGAGAAGAGAARKLTGRDDLDVTLVARTEETPYTRMLIKGVAFGPTPAEMIRLTLPETVLRTDTAEAVEPSQRQVRLASGETIDYESLIIATGSSPRSLPGHVAGAREAVTAGRATTLHSLEDALGIQDRLTGLGRPARVAVYGGGVIAAETASTLHADGHQVMLITRSAVPGMAAFGAPVAEHLAAAHAKRVHARFGRTVRHLEVTDGGVIVTLDDDSPVLADLLLLALGTTPHAPAPWPAGIEVDDRLRSGVQGVYAAGGTAIHHDDRLGQWRIDHWEDAGAQGAHAASSVLHDLGLAPDPGPYRPRSPFMAMVHGEMVSGVGLTGHGEPRIEEAEEFVIRHELDGAVVGVSGIDAVSTVYGWGPRLHVR